MKKIQFINDNFKLSAYSSCAKWEIEDWAIAFNGRDFMRGFLEKGKSIDFCLPRYDQYRLRADQLILSPLGGGRKFLDDPFSKPIVDQSVAQYFEGVDFINEKEFSKWAIRKKRYDDVDIDNCDIDEPIPVSAWKYQVTSASAMLTELGFPKNRLFVGVDLGATDDFIVREFKKWLKEKRKYNCSARLINSFGTNDLSDWHNQKLLPCLDLWFWIVINGFKVDFCHMAGCLFPFDTKNCDDYVDKIRKTIKPKALSVIDPMFLSSLRYQVKNI